MRIIKIGSSLQIDFSDGKNFNTIDCSPEMWEFINQNYHDENAIKEYLNIKDNSSELELKERVKNSNILTLRGNSVYMLSVSELSIPEDFVEKILEAEENEDVAELTKFKNFWTLVSLNPDSRVRNNLFWFIRKWDMQISESGFIIAYRNADLKKESKYTSNETKKIIYNYYYAKKIEHKDPKNYVIEIDGKNINLEEAYNDVINDDGSPIYTDHHSHTTEIKLGHPVRMPREACNANQEDSCSRGLHCGAKGWLKENYFGSYGLMVLVNPANVVAVPTIDEYGKMRTCEYYPVALIDFDEEGNIIEKEYSLHDDVAYLKQIQYEGNINNNDIDNYELKHSYTTREEMYDNILSSLNFDN